MEEYKIELYTKSKVDADQINNIIMKLNKLGYLLKCNGEEFSPEQIFDFLANRKGTIQVIKNNIHYFYADLSKQRLCLYSSFLRRHALVEFKHGLNPDTISFLKLFLYLTESLILKCAYMQSDLKLFDHLIPSISDEDKDFEIFTSSEKKQAKDLNAIHAYPLISKKKHTSDALDIIDQADEYNYQFIDNLQNLKFYNFPLSILEQAIQKDQPTTVYLKSENFIMKLIFNNQLVSLYPLEPFKMKTRDDETGIDIAFYLSIYLNLFEPFGIDDLITTFYKKLEYDIELPTTIIKFYTQTWDFIEDFNGLLIIEQFKHLKNLDKTLTIDLSNIVIGKTTKEAILKMKNFLDLVKKGVEIAKEMNKDYLFSSRYPIPPIIKKWFNKHNINFREMNHNRWHK